MILNVSALVEKKKKLDSLYTPGSKNLPEFKLTLPPNESVLVEHHGKEVIVLGIFKWIGKAYAAIKFKPDDNEYHLCNPEYLQ